MEPDGITLVIIHRKFYFAFLEKIFDTDIAKEGVYIAWRIKIQRIAFYNYLLASGLGFEWGLAYQEVNSQSLYQGHLGVKHQYRCQKTLQRLACW
jgi:hypothetical protein